MPCYDPVSVPYDPDNPSPNTVEIMRIPVPSYAKVAPTKTLRDEFALVGLGLFSQNLHLAADRKGAIKNAAESAYQFADAMMERRNK